MLEDFEKQLLEAAKYGITEEMVATAAMNLPNEDCDIEGGFQEYDPDALNQMTQEYGIDPNAFLAQIQAMHAAGQLQIGQPIEVEATCDPEEEEPQRQQNDIYAQDENDEAWRKYEN